MSSLRRILDQILRGAIALLMAGMALNVTWQVITRFVLRSPSSMTEEIARYSMIWLGLLGAAYCAGQRSHLALDLMTMRLKGSPRRALGIFIETVMLLFALVILVGGGGRLVWISLQLGQISAATGVKLGYIYLSLPVSGVLIALYATMDLIKTIKSSDADYPSAEAGKEGAA